MKRTVLVIGSIIGILLILLQLSKYTFYRGESSFEWWLAAVLFFALAVGLYLGSKNNKTPEQASEPDFKMIEKLGITSREMEVLQAVQKGLSNAEIAAELNVSETTIKSHVSNLLVKLDAKRRTQAVANALKWSVLIEK